MEHREHNEVAWDRQVEEGNRWTVPVSPGEIAAARRGEWSLRLTPQRPVPRRWFPPLDGCDVLGLAAGGGQQGPLLAAAGARVTVLDLSPRQLARDRETAEREGLRIGTVQGDMADLGAFADGSFDLVVHPVANCFVPDVRPVWREAFRVLRPGGLLLAGFANPVLYLFADDPETGVMSLTATRRLPWSDLEGLDAAARDRARAAGEPLEFGHLLEDQIGGQLAAGFVLTDLYEDHWAREGMTLDAFTPLFIATRAVRPADPAAIR